MPDARDELTILLRDLAAHLDATVRADADAMLAPADVAAAHDVIRAACTHLDPSVGQSPRGESVEKHEATLARDLQVTVGLLADALDTRIST